MRSERKSQIITMLVLFIGVTGLAIGFSVFSSTLTISSGANIDPDPSSFSVAFSTTTTPGVTTSPMCSPIGGAIIDTSAISITEAEISGLNAVFTEIGQSIKCTFYVHNTGEHVAYLNNIYFSGLPDTGASKNCKAISGTSQDEVDHVCEDIDLTIRIEGDSGILYATSYLFGIGRALGIDKYDTVDVEIAYNGTTEPPGGDFIIEFGTIMLEYHSMAVTSSS